jgi:hypothetical protein
MERKMAVPFRDEELYIRLKAEADRRQMSLSDAIADAVREWLENCEDEELMPTIETTRAEWKEKGGRPWSEIERD